MKLVRARVTNYRNILDSNPVDIGDTTCLVGKNEAGKPAFLKALEELRSTDPSFKQYGKVESYPRRFLADYKTRHPDEEAKVVATDWEMSAQDAAVITAELGDGVLTGNRVVVEKHYEQDGTAWTLPLDGIEAELAQVKQRETQRAFVAEYGETLDSLSALVDEFKSSVEDLEPAGASCDLLKAKSQCKE